MELIDGAALATICSAISAIAAAYFGFRRGESVTNAEKIKLESRLQHTEQELLKERAEHERALARERADCEHALSTERVALNLTFDVERANLNGKIEAQQTYIEYMERERRQRERAANRAYRELKENADQMLEETRQLEHTLADAKENEMKLQVTIRFQEDRIKELEAERERESSGD